MKKAFLFLLSISFFLALPLTVEAKSPAYTINLNPETKLNYTTTPGSKITDFITIRNIDTTRWIEVAIKTRNIPTRWVQEENKKFRIKPNETLKVNINILIPTNAKIEEISGYLTFSLANYDKTNTETTPGALSIGLGIGQKLTINIIPGEENKTNFTKKTYKLNINIKETISNIYIFIQNNINIVLLLIIAALIIKLALQEKKIITKTEKINPTKPKSKPKKTKKRLDKKAKKTNEKISKKKTIKVKAKKKKV